MREETSYRVISCAPGLFTKGADGERLHRDVVAPNHCLMRRQTDPAPDFPTPYITHSHYAHTPTQAHVPTHRAHTYTYTHSCTHTFINTHNLTHRHAYMHVPLTYLQPRAFAHSGTQLTLPDKRMHTHTHSRCYHN